MASERLLRTLGLLYLAIVIFVIYLLRMVWFPFALSLLLYILLDPLVDWTSRLTKFRTLAIALVVTAAVLILTLAAFFIIPALLHDMNHFFQTCPQLIDHFSQKVIPLIERWFHIEVPGSWHELLSTLRDHLTQWIPSHFASVGAILSKVSSTTYGIILFLLNLVLIPFFTFFLLSSADPLSASLTQWLPPRQKGHFLSLFKKIGETLSGFVRGQLMVGLILALLFSVGLSIIHLPFSLAIGVVAGLASIVPYLGFILGILLSLLAAILSFQGWWIWVGIAVVFAVAQVIESFVLTPYFVGKQVGLPPFLVVLAVIAGGQFGGMTGILLAIPTAAVLKILGEAWLAAYRKSPLYS
ncbi:MAG: AI-2E family transporter [Deltaproteobacteria bacterium]|nr:AI-2E family transporter [Deltaproteobacteria bacterium]